MNKIIKACPFSFIGSKGNEPLSACLKDGCYFWDKEIGPAGCIFFKVLFLRAVNEKNLAFESENFDAWNRQQNNKKDENRFDYV